MPGCRPMNDMSRGVSHTAEKKGATLTLRISRAPDPVILPTATSIASKAPLLAAKRISPALVSSFRPAPRAKRRAESSISNALICRLTAACVTPSSRAAR